MNNKPGVGVGVMILNGNGEVLLGHRHDDAGKADSALHGEGTWTMPGGKLDFGESLENCGRREVLEETGLKARSLQLISVGNEIRSDAHFVTIGFLCRDFEGQPEVKEPDEITEWRWFRLDRPPEKMFPPALKILNNYKAGKIMADCEDKKN